MHVVVLHKNVFLSVTSSQVPQPVANVSFSPAPGTSVLNNRVFGVFPLFTAEAQVDQGFGCSTPRPKYRCFGTVLFKNFGTDYTALSIFSLAFGTGYAHFLSSLRFWQSSFRSLSFTENWIISFDPVLSKLLPIFGTVLTIFGPDISHSFLSADFTQFFGSDMA